MAQLNRVDETIVSAENSRTPVFCFKECQIYLGTTYQNRENIPNEPKNIPNGCQCIPNCHRYLPDGHKMA
jgi:hypothetical protein